MKASFEAIDPWVNRVMPLENEADHEGEAAGSQHVRAVFISDLHLGTPGFQASALLEFLKQHPATTCTWLATSSTDGSFAAAGFGRKPITTWYRNYCAVRAKDVT